MTEIAERIEALQRDLATAQLRRDVLIIDALAAVRQLDQRQVCIEALEGALRPLARYATKTDERMFPDLPDSQLISVRLGDLRAAARALIPEPAQPPEATP